MHDHRPSLPHAPSVLASFCEASAKSTLLRFASMLALGAGVTQCVPSKSYDEARTAAEAEFAAHGRTRLRLEAAHERIRTLEQTLAERERALETGESSVAAAKLETVVATKDRQAAMELVEQLRSELARTGNHLVAFSDEKRDLARALLLAEERVKSIEAAEKNIDELVATAHDLGGAIGDGAETEGVELGARNGRIVLSIPEAKLFADGSGSLVVEAAPLLAAVSKVANAHPRVRIVLAEPEADEHASARVTRLGQALVERGVPEARLHLPLSKRPTVPVATESVPSEEAADVAGPTAPSATPDPPAAPRSPSQAEATDEPVRYDIQFAI